MKKKRLSYKDAGVDVAGADDLVKDIALAAQKTFRPKAGGGVIGGIGSFGALFSLDTRRWKNPVLVSGTDGVGTKLKIAFLAKRHDTIGIDLVAMCVNDILTLGAEPLFFLDYLASGKLDKKVSVDIIGGIAAGCIEAGCSLIGGETAEMPGFYARGEYDVAGFAVGVVDKKDIIDGSTIGEGDAVIGIPSSGLHSNGYSLARKIFFDVMKATVKTRIEGFLKPVGEELLTPTRIYVKVIGKLKKAVKIKGMAHITGGGITGNLPRVLPAGLGAEIWKNSWNIPPIFEVMRREGGVTEKEMLKTFNMGIGFIVVVNEKDADKTIKTLNAKNSSACGPACRIGRIFKGKGVVYRKTKP
jgi:phosphoribosylformylglycinamidine cyclo-ligase